MIGSPRQLIDFKTRPRTGHKEDYITMMDYNFHLLV